MAALSNPLSLLVKTPAVAIDGVFANVTFAGLAPGFVGLYQLNVQAPSGLTANPNAALVISGNKGVSNLTRLATTFAGNGFVSAAGPTDSSGQVTLKVGSLTLPFRLRDGKTSLPLANLVVSVGMDSTNPGRAAVTLLDPSGTYPTQAVVLTGAGTAGPAAFFAADAGQTIPVAVSKPASVTDAFFMAANQLKTLLLPAPTDSGNSNSGSLANSFQAALTGVLKLLPGTPTINKSEDMDTAKAAQELSPLPQKGKVVFDFSKSALTALLSYAVLGESLGAALSAELPILGAEMLVEIAPSLLVRGVYDPLGYKYVRVISLGGFIGLPGQQIEIVIPLATAPLDTPAPVAPVRLRTLPPISDSNVILLHIGDGPFTYQGTTGPDGSTQFLARPGKYKMRLIADGFDPTNSDLTVPDSGLDATVPGPSATFTLTVTKWGDGSGSVTSDGGITCGSTCSARYPSGAVVKLTATPLTGSTFTGWSGACSGTGACSVTMDADKAVTATFVTAPGPGPLVFSAEATLLPGTLNVPYRYSFCHPEPSSATALCGTFPPTTNPSGGQPPYHFQLGSGVGFPPFGLSLNLNGLLAGTPTAAGTSTFSVCAVDLWEANICRTVSLTINSTARTYAGPFTGQTTVTSSFSSCAWNNVIAGDITVKLSGSGTPADPFTGTATGVGNDTVTVASGPAYCASGAQVVPLNTTSPVSGSAGTVEWHGTIPGLGTWDFVDGRISVDTLTLTGTLTISNPGLWDRSIVRTLTLNRQP
jgi:hypothetical protein